ncbi:P-loop NTPase fold protein [Okeania sp. SIO1F9]|uniref:P-loop NTPase fold protein n=1 Tax=Okeania sp. SIO1F9 TaxID=2607813 RepID=UPI00144FC436|nr:P-loop NTPase fold protein [Okeania sp. SIO1F9]NET74616.1 ATP-binding protein [Okeania sp. SIO1F9]
MGLLDLQKFFQATNPSQVLKADSPEDEKYYIDFSEVRGGKIIEELQENITFFSPDEPTCELFTGHIGCGKSTELLRLKEALEKAEFHVVYFESSQDLEMGDVDIGDIMLAIARRITESIGSLEKITLPQPRGFQRIIDGATRLLQTEIDLSAEATLPGVGEISASSEGKFSVEAGLPGIGKVKASDDEGVSLALGIGKITAKTKKSLELRKKLKDYLEPQTDNILETINIELIEPTVEKLKQDGKKGLVVIVDNLDRVENIIKSGDRPQPEYLFVDRGENLRLLKCHVIYTMPLSLMFSNDYNRLTSRLAVEPKVLPMVPVRLRDGNECALGMKNLRQMVLARAFPDLAPEQRLGLISEVFDAPETLDRLCQVSGGHVRELLQLLRSLITKERKLPLSREWLEKVIRDKGNQMKLGVDDQEWELLRQVQESQEVKGDREYQILVGTRLVYEYRDSQGSWFQVNPILAELGNLI